jgi:F0F1-type ATP synthase assembly protein I
MNGNGDPTHDAPRSQHLVKLEGMNEGMRVLSYLISGVMMYGFLGWLGDRFLGTSFLLPIGIVAGAALGCFVIIRRFGRVDEPAPQSAERPAGKPSGNTKEGVR